MPLDAFGCLWMPLDAFGPLGGGGWKGGLLSDPIGVVEIPIEKGNF